MRLAFEEAFRAVGKSEPNPAVGALLLSADGHIIGRGHTGEPGANHAEVNAIEQARSSFPDKVKGSTLFVTLEPCTHFGRTPPCSLAIQQAEIKAVYAASRDPNPKQNGNAFDALLSRGILAEHTGEKTFEEEIFWTTGPFLRRLKRGRPALILKWAQSMEGHIGIAGRASGKLSGPCSMEIMHRLRSLFHFIGATPGTIRTDYPRLTSRPGQCSLAGMPGDTPLRRILKLRENGLAHERPTERFFLLPQNADFYEKSETSDWIREVELADGKNYFGVPPALSVRSFDGRNIFPLPSLIFFGNSPHLPELNHILLEAGTGASDGFLREGVVDYLVVFRTQSYLPEGRGNAISLTMARQIPDGWKLREHILYEDADMLFLEKADAD